MGGQGIENHGTPLAQTQRLSSSFIVWMIHMACCNLPMVLCFFFVYVKGSNWMFTGQKRGQMTHTSPAFSCFLMFAISFSYKARQKMANKMLTNMFLPVFTHFRHLCILLGSSAQPKPPPVGLPELIHRVIFDPLLLVNRMCVIR